MLIVINMSLPLTLWRHVMDWFVSRCLCVSHWKCSLYLLASDSDKGRDKKDGAAYDTGPSGGKGGGGDGKGSSMSSLGDLPFLNSGSLTTAPNSKTAGQCTHWTYIEMWVMNLKQRVSRKPQPSYAQLKMSIFSCVHLVVCQMETPVFAVMVAVCCRSSRLLKTLWAAGVGSGQLPFQMGL